MSDRPLDALIEASTVGVLRRPMIDVARVLVGGGWPVFPCGHDKAPLVSGGFKSRSDDIAQVEQWWGQHPDAMPAICPGDRGLAALDIDTAAAWGAVVDAGLNPAGGLSVITGGTSKPFDLADGTKNVLPMHVYIRAAEQPKIPGVVVRYRGGYVIAPGARRGDRVYYVLASGELQDWKPAGPPPVSNPPAPAPNPAAPYERVEEAVMCVPNTEGTPREQYVGMAHMIRGSLGEAGRELFLRWAAKYPNAEKDEDERVWDTLPPSKIGWTELWHLAAVWDFDASPERRAEAEQDFAGEVPVLEIEDTYTKLNHMLAAVRDAKNGIDRSLALMRLRRAGFSSGEIRGMLSELAPTVSDEGYTLRELSAMPELLKVPEPAIPNLCWPGLKTIFSAREKTGKSTLAMAGAAAVTRGAPFLGQDTRRQSVLWLTEEPLAIAYQRSSAMNADVDNFVVLAMGANPQAQLRRAFDRWAPAVVVVDTLFRFANLEGDGENDAGTWTPILLLFDEVTKAGAGLLILAHATKGGVNGEYRGSSAIGGFVDAILEMKRPKLGENVRRVFGRGRLHFGKPFDVRLLDEVAGTFELMADATPAGGARPDAVVEYLEDNPGASSTQIAAALNKNRTMIQEQLEKMEADKVLKCTVGAHNKRGWHVADPFEGDNT